MKNRKKNIFILKLKHFYILLLKIRHLLTRSLQRVGTRQRSTTIYMTEVAPTNRD